MSSNRPISSGDSILNFPYADKFMHISAWFILALTLRFGFDSFITTSNNQIILRNSIIFLIAVFYGIFDEIHQYYVPTRVMDVWDVIADVFGAFLGIITGVFIRQYHIAT